MNTTFVAAQSDFLETSAKTGWPVLLLVFRHGSSMT